MANKRLDYDKIYDLVMQCRKSGLSDRQWCIDHDIVPSTFYYWIQKLQDLACYDIPDKSRFHNNSRVINPKQDVVCVNTLSEKCEEEHLTPTPVLRESAPVMLQYKDAKIAVSDDFNEQTLKRLLLTLKEVLC